uniref:Uncharacterized protein n=1 Tax=mine drainage metagenome TaxID=410659 RepID=E6PXM2_9ZZZZ
MNISAKTTRSPTPRHAYHGLVLPHSTLKALQKRGIYCTPGVSLEHQHLARRYVLRGVESGGAVSDMGRACAFVAEDGSPLPWLQHKTTRRYLNIRQNSQRFYRYLNGEYVEISQAAALEHVRS